MILFFKKYSLHFLFLLFSSVFLFSCKTTQKLVTTPPIEAAPLTSLPDTLPRQKDSLKAIILQQIETNTFDFKNYSSKINIDLTKLGNTQSFTANIRVVKDSCIWVSITPALGIEIARLFITQDSVFMLDRLKNIAILKPYSYLKEMGIPFDFHAFQQAISGNPMYVFQERQKVFVEKGSPLLITTQDTISSSFFINPLNSLLYKIIIVDNKNSQSIFYEFTRFEEPIIINNKNIKLSSLRNLVYKKDQTEIKVDLELKNIKVNTELLNIPFDIPESFERIK